MFRRVSAVQFCSWLTTITYHPSFALIYISRMILFFIPLYFCLVDYFSVEAGILCSVECWCLQCEYTPGLYAICMLLILFIPTLSLQRNWPHILGTENLVFSMCWLVRSAKVWVFCAIPLLMLPLIQSLVYSCHKLGVARSTHNNIGSLPLQSMPWLTLYLGCVSVSIELGPTTSSPFQTHHQRGVSSYDPASLPGQTYRDNCIHCGEARTHTGRDPNHTKTCWEWHDEWDRVPWQSENYRESYGDDNEEYFHWNCRYQSNR